MSDQRAPATPVAEPGDSGDDGHHDVYDIHHPSYFRPDALETEMRRIYDICHGCRLCFNLCPSFPSLFQAVDRHEEAGEGETAALNDDELWEVVDLCYNCKLCYPKCPYTPPHTFNLDFPRLMLRAKAVEAKQSGIPLTDRFLGRPDVVGKIGCACAPIANAVQNTRVGRILMEKTVGLHRDFNIPTFAGESFPHWFARASREREGKHTGAPAGRVALFSTCTNDYQTVAAAQAITQVLWHNRVEVIVPEQVCCGMPALDGGDVDGAVRLARENVARFHPLIQRGYDIVIGGPTCGFVFKDDYPRLLGTPEAEAVSQRTYDFSEYLLRQRGEGKLSTQFARGAGRVGLHFPCHLKVQNIGHKTRDLLALIPDTEVVVVDKCSVVDGTWGMKTENFALSQKYAQKLYRGLENSEADVYVSDCPLSRQQIAYGTKKPAFHPAEILRDAYGLTAPT